MALPLAQANLPTQRTSSDITAHIQRLFIYPVKSCAGIELTESPLCEFGLDLDRAWMVVDANGDFVTQREHARLALIKPQLKANELILRAPGMLALHVNIDAVEAPAQVTVWNDTVSAYDMGNIAAQWFTDFLSLTDAGLPGANAPKFRMVRFDPDHKRLANTTWTKGAEAMTQFADGYPMLVLSQASLDALNVKLVAAGQTKVGIERFRPNIVIAGVDAHDEDRLNELTITTAEGPVSLSLVKPCPRCPIPNINPATATSNPTVGDMLQTYRQDPRVDGSITFGMNAITTSGFDAVLRVGHVVAGNFQFD